MHFQTRALKFDVENDAKFRTFWPMWILGVGWAKSLYQLLKLYIRPNLRNTFDGQWRRQDLLRGGAKLEIGWWGTHGELQGRVQLVGYSMTNSFVTNAVLIRRTVSCWHLHQLISRTIYNTWMHGWLSDLLQSELRMKLLEVEGGTCRRVATGGGALESRAPLLRPVPPKFPVSP